MTPNEFSEMLRQLAGLKAAGLGVESASLVMLGFLLWRIRMMDARLRALTEAVAACPTCRKHLRFPVEPVIAVALALAGILLAGCTSVRQEVQTTETATNGTTTTREVKARAVTLFDGRSVVREMRLSGGKTASIGVEGQETEAHGTNAAATLDAVTRLLQSIR